jgi:CRP/FNR family transcriptional regulator, cyclic AMP receptor protein
LIQSNQSRLLDVLTPVGREVLLGQSIERRFASGEILWSAGDRSEGIALVLEGKVRIVRGSGGRQMVIHSGEAGDTLGEVPFFTGSVYPATAIAGEPTRCLFLTHAAVTRAMAADPGVAMFFLRRLSQRVEGLVERVDQNTVSSVQKRLARFILERSQAPVIASRSSSGKAKRNTFSLGMTQSALAEEIGTVREVVVRALRELRESGAIESVGDGKYRVSDLATLEQLAHAGT